MFTNFRFEISASSNVRWEDIKWQPIVIYKNSENKEQQWNTSADMKLYSNHVFTAEPYVFAEKDSLLSIKPKLTFKPLVSYDGNVTLTVKAINKLLGKRSIQINTEESVTDSIIINRSEIEGDTVWFEIFSNDTQLSNKLLQASVSIDNPEDTLSLVAPKIIAVNLYTSENSTGFGPLYRGWGGFTYNTAEGRYANPINESLLNLPEDEDTKVDPLTWAFTPIGTDLNTLDRWSGQRPEIYLTASEMGTARLSEQNVVLSNPFDDLDNVASLAGECLQGTGAVAITQEVVSTSDVTQTGLIGITKSDATGESTTRSTMMDMNGDGYPDIIANGTIQYTNTLGGISGERYTGIGTISSNNAATTWGAGSSPVVSASMTIAHMSGWKPASENQTSSKASKASVDVSLGIPHNEDHSTESFVDVNGDGLPDKIQSDKKVRLNYGYSFSEPIDWNIDRIQGGEATSVNIGADAGIPIKNFEKGSTSFAGGYNMVTTQNGEQYNLMDVNSDGLPDKVWVSGEGIMVAFNIGNGFTEAISWEGATALNKSASTSESGNVAFTVNVTPKIIPIKFSVNPNVSLSNSISRVNYTLQDVDGDGYLDIVESDKESELKVTRSAIGRTNMLKSVVNSLGGTFTLDYEHTDPTYGLPGGNG